MKITYAISLEDFRSLQPPFAAKPGLTLGFKAALVFLAGFAAFGLFLIEQGFGFAIGGFLIALAAVGACAAYFFEKRSVADSKVKYERSIVAAYQGLHCRDARTLETTDDGFTASCKCGTVTRPWSQLARVVETNRLFVVGTNRSADRSEDRVSFRR